MHIEENPSSENAISLSVNQTTEIHEEAARILRAVCSNFGWEVGILWSLDQSESALVLEQAWCSLESDLAQFEEESRHRTFARGEGIPGSVWSTGNPLWCADLAKDFDSSTVALAAQNNLRSAFACPVTVGDRTLGVLEFFCQRYREPDANLSELLCLVAGSLGQVLERKSTEQTLRLNEQELADFFDNATVGLHWVGPDGTILRANRAELELLGYRPEEYIGRHIADFHADQEVIDDILVRLRAGEQLRDYPARLMCKDGSIKEVLIDSSALFRDDRFIHTRCFTRDVTERNQIDQQLHETQRRFQAVFNQQFQFMAILTPDGTIMDANETCFRATGISREQVMGRHLWDTPWWNRLPEIQDQLKRFVSDAARSGGPVFGDLDYSLADGTTRHATAVVTGLKDENGIVTSIVIEGHDDTERLRQEIALRESEAKLRLMADSIPQLAWMAQPDGHIFWYNRRWYEYTGTTPEQMDGWGWQSVHDPNVLPTVLEKWRGSLASGEPFDMVFPLKGADEVFRPFLTRVSPFRDAENQIIYWFGTNTDISELKEAREALATNEERLRLALDAGRMGVWDWNILTGELAWSDSLEPLHGLAPGTFRGTFEHFQQLIHPSDRDSVNQAIERAVQNRSTFDIEFRNLRPNGAVHWIAGNGRVLVDEYGMPVRMIGIGMDVTERKRSEQTALFLADTSAALAQLVDFDSTLQKVATLAVPYFADWATVDVLEADGTLRRVAVAHVDPQKVELANDLNRRFPPDPHAPSGIWNILRTGEAELVSEITDELLSNSTTNDELLQVLRTLGLTSYIGVPLRVRGKVLGVLSFIVAESGHIYDDNDLAVARDLASRASIAIENSQLYRELRDADRHKDEFLATLAHELRNPLAPIRNGLQVLRLTGSGGELVDETRSMMERQLNQMVRLVDDLLDISRITRNKFELRKERVLFASVVHSAVEASRPLIEDGGHTFSLKLPTEPIVLHADPTRLAQVISNLLNNSAKYTEPGGHIAVVGTLNDGEVVLSVTDNGLGIPAEAIPRLFQMFSQFDHNIERAQGGLGIGLSLVRRLVDLHGGTVTAHSEGVGRGSEFTVRLPIHHTHPTSLPGSDKEKTASREHCRILVVDDNRDSATTLMTMLKLLGNEVRTAHDGLAAVEAAEQFQPDFILLDIGLPKLNGYEVCRVIRKQAWSDSVIIVALTGWGQEEDRRRSAQAGFDHHLVKPVELEKLTDILNQ